MSYFFTSESVSEGHPDKVADQISDALLDEFLRRDPESHVACETLVTTGLAVVSGEVTCNGWWTSRRLSVTSSKRLATPRANISSRPSRALCFPPSMARAATLIRVSAVRKKRNKALETRA